MSATTDQALLVYITVPAYAVEVFKSTGQAPAAWSQQAVTEAVRSALVAQAVPTTPAWVIEEQARRAQALQCDMDKGCQAQVTMIDAKGYTYCATHGLQRRQAVPTRKLRPAELRKLATGQQIERY